MGISLLGDVAKEELILGAEVSAQLFSCWSQKLVLLVFSTSRFFVELVCVFNNTLLFGRILDLQKNCKRST